MDFTFVEFPCTVDFNTFKAYFNPTNMKLPKSLQNNETHTAAYTKQPKSLRHTVLDIIIANWNEQPIFKEIPRQEDRNYILSNLDVNLPLKQLSAHVCEDFFWRKCYLHRWKTYQTPAPAKAWISIYMERHLQEFIENVETCDYEQESAQEILDICATYINQLEISYLQPNGDGHNDHIPLDFILNYLPELQMLRLTYCAKTVGTHFYLGCNMLSQNDILSLVRGLSRCHELLHFCLHTTKLEAYQLHLMARSLDKGCHKLATLSFKHCCVRDSGIRQFMDACTKESFATLEELDLTNNNISPDGAFLLSRALRGMSLKKLVLRLNPIESDGTAAIFSVLCYLPLKYLDISGCSICEAITKLFMQLIIQNKTLTYLDVSNNALGEEFGKNLYKIVGFNTILEYLDFRNTGITLMMRNKFKEIFHINIIKNKKQK